MYCGGNFSDSSNHEPNPDTDRDERTGVGNGVDTPVAGTNAGSNTKGSCPIAQLISRLLARPVRAFLEIDRDHNGIGIHPGQWCRLPGNAAMHGIDLYLTISETHQRIYLRLIAPDT